MTSTLAPNPDAPLNAFQIRKAAALVFAHPLPHMLEYLDEKEAQDRHPNHVRGIRNALIHFSNYVHRIGGIDTQYDIERQHLVRYQGWVGTQPWAKGYQVELLKRLRGWLNWCVDVGYLETSPWIRIRSGVVLKKPNPLSDDELGLLFEQHRQSAFRISPFVFHRREMMLCLLYGWGLRVHELVALDTRHMDVSLDFVRAINKGGGGKTLPYTPEMKKVFQRWAGVRARVAQRDEDALLITRLGDRYSQSDIYRTIVDLGERAHITINPHRLRDTCGTHLLDSDVPVERVSQILGHTNIRQTLAYSRVNNTKVRESQIAAMDPRLRNLLTTFHNTSTLREE